MQIDVSVQVDLSNRWRELCGKKNSIVNLAKEYARWTLPYMFPEDNTASVELQLAKDSIGAQAVNHLSNKVVSVLFPPQRMFFRLVVPEQMKQMATAAMAQQSPDLAQAKDAVEKSMVQVEESLLSSEKMASDYLDMVQYRPQAVNAAKLLIITGNALEYHPENSPVQVFNLNDYCVQRDLSGQVIEIMTKQSKAFETFSPEVQEQLRMRKEQGRKPYGAQDDICIYTQIKLENDGKFHVYQAGDNVWLDTEGVVFTKDKLPWIPLTWNLVTGEDYGRGLVGEYAGAFHAINVLSGALLNLAAIMGDIKFLVNPMSMVDIPELNRAPAGSYHSGKADDVTAIQTNKSNDVQFIASMIERYERQVAQAFLLNSALTRDAERVTAEEIRAQANELETSNGGIYSRLAGTWQVQLANIILDHIDFDLSSMGIKAKVITGMDSLSRTGELDNIRMFLADLGMLNAVPEDVRAAIDIPAFASVIGTNRQVEYQKFIKSAAQMQAERDAAIAQQQALMQQEGEMKAKEAASTQAMKETQNG